MENTRAERNLCFSVSDVARGAEARWVAHFFPFVSEPIVTPSTRRQRQTSAQRDSLISPANAQAVSPANVKLSIPVPVYNFAEFLPENAGSILSQEGAEQVEVIVVDGASSDSTPN